MSLCPTFTLFLRFVVTPRTSPELQGLVKIGLWNIMLRMIQIYSYRRCPFAMRVRFVLHEKAIPFEVIEEDLKNFSPKLKALHPEAKVPVLVHGDVVLYESAIITEYLEDAFPTPKLMPDSASKKAEVRLWTYWCNQIFKPDLDRLKYGKSRFPENECVGIESKIQAHLQKLESHLQKSPWLAGDSFSLADIHVFPFVRQLFRVESATPFFSTTPTLTRWIDTLSNRPAFLSTIKK